MGIASRGGGSFSWKVTFELISNLIGKKVGCYQPCSLGKSNLQLLMRQLSRAGVKRGTGACDVSEAREGTYSMGGNIWIQ